MGLGGFYSRGVEHGGIDEKSRSELCVCGVIPVVRRRNFVIIHTMLECMLAILKGPESIGRYEGMDLDLKGGRNAVAGAARRIRGWSSN